MSKQEKMGKKKWREVSQNGKKLVWEEIRKGEGDNIERF